MWVESCRRRRLAYHHSRGQVHFGGRLRASTRSSASGAVSDVTKTQRGEVHADYIQMVYSRVEKVCRRLLPRGWRSERYIVESAPCVQRRDCAAVQTSPPKAWLPSLPPRDVRLACDSLRMSYYPQQNQQCEPSTPLDPRGAPSSAPRVGAHEHGSHRADDHPPPDPQQQQPAYGQPPAPAPYVYPPGTQRTFTLVSDGH